MCVPCCDTYDTYIQTILRWTSVNTTNVENLRETPTKKSWKQILLPLPSLQSICQCPKFPKRVNILHSLCLLEIHCLYAYKRILVCFYTEKHDSFLFGFQRLGWKWFEVNDEGKNIRFLGDSKGLSGRGTHNPPLLSQVKEMSPNCCNSFLSQESVLALSCFTPFLVSSYTQFNALTRGVSGVEFRLHICHQHHKQKMLQFT